MKKKGIAVLVLALIILPLLLGSCATTFKASNGKLAYGAMTGTSRGTFENRAAAISIISPYIFPITKPYENLDKLIDPELSARGANAAENVEIKYGFDIIGLLISSVTGGLLNWGYVSVSGNALSR